MNWRYFQFHEFTCQCGCRGNDIDASFVDKLDELRQAVGFPFIITSGYRCPDHNEKVSSTQSRTGPHTTGRAVDILASHANAVELVAVGYRMGFKGFGVNQKGEGRIIHLDDARPHLKMWSY